MATNTPSSSRLTLSSTSQKSKEDEAKSSMLNPTLADNDEKTTLLSLPAEVLELIGFYCAISAPGRMPLDAYAAHSLTLDDNSKKEQQELELCNDDESIASAKVPAYATPPVNLRNLVLTCKTVYNALNFKTNNRLYADIFRTKFDVGAIRRRYGKRAVRSQSLTSELQRRCICLKRIRKAVANKSIYPSQHDVQAVPAGAGVSGSAAEARAAAAQADILENLWLAYMMITENDGLNVRQLQWAQMRAYLGLYRSQDILMAAMQQGYPPNTSARALALQLDYLLTRPRDLASETREESAEKLFILRPFVFAAHKYDAFLMPWTLKHVPACDRRADCLSDRTASLHLPAHLMHSSANPFLADLMLKEQSMTLQHCGQTLSIRAPNITHAASCSFFMKVERDPGVSGPLFEAASALRDSGSGINGGNGLDANAASPSSLSDISAASPTSSASSSLSSSASSSSLAERRLGARAERNLCTKDPYSLTSVDHDRDVARLISCASPIRSPGLRVADHLGQMQGSWEGRFTFFDFDSYRDMLGGKVRALYEGPFGEQPQVWKVKEHVVKVKQGERPGGKGSMLNGGFTNDDVEPNKMDTLSKDRLARLHAAANKQPSVLGKRGSQEPDWQDGARTRAMRGGRLVSPPNDLLDDWPNFPSFDDQEDGVNQSRTVPVQANRSANVHAPSSSSDCKSSSSCGSEDETCSMSDTSSSSSSDDDDQYEILLSGEGHSAWGKFTLRGRIRTWDGLVSMTKEYTPDGRGRWLYRGYVVAGDKLVGRWRDTFTPENLSGYEGCFLLQRRGV